MSKCNENADNFCMDEDMQALSILEVKKELLIADTDNKIKDTIDLAVSTSYDANFLVPSKSACI